MEIEKQIAVVTGAASGLGQATANLLAAMGAKVALLDQDPVKLQLAAAKLGGLAISCDVTSDVDVRDAFVEIEEKLGLCNILVNCAGIAPAQKIVGRDGPHDLELFSKVINVNLVGSFNVMRFAAEQMKRGDPNEDGEKGVIINTASIAAYEGQIGQAAYAASKGGIVSLTLPAAREFAPTGIRVNAIAPGLFATPMVNAMPEDVQESLAATLPFPTRFGQPEEFAKLVLHIIENPLLNGEVIRLDNALRMQAR